MKAALLTGATGFIGGNVAVELLRCGYRVRALVRTGSDRSNIAGLDLEVVEGDLRDRPSLDRALAGCDALFHVAACYTFWARDPRLIYETNVVGTRNLLEAARVAATPRIVYTSSESTVGIARGGVGGGIFIRAGFHRRIARPARGPLGLPLSP